MRKRIYFVGLLALLTMFNRYRAFAQLAPTIINYPYTSDDQVLDESNSEASDDCGAEECEASDDADSCDDCDDYPDESANYDYDDSE